MTPLANFLHTMRHEDPEWIPLDVPATPPVEDLIQRRTGAASPAEAFNLDFRNVSYRQPDLAAAWRAAFEKLGQDVPADAEILSEGITHTAPLADDSVSGAYHFRQLIHPLSAITDVEQLKDLPWPDPSDPAAYEHLGGEVAAIHDAGRVAVGGRECTFFEHAWYVRGMDNLFMDLHEDNGIADWLLDWYTDRAVQNVKGYARAGVDVIALGDDVGTQRGMMLAVDSWRTQMKPRLKRVIDAIRATQQDHIYIRYHSDGNITDILEDLIELGIDILNPVQPECMDPGEVIPAYQDRLAFWGMVGTQTTMPFGTPDEVRQVVRDCKALAEGGAALVIAPTHVLEPDVPWDNIHALVDEVQKP